MILFTLCIRFSPVLMSMFRFCLLKVGYDSCQGLNAQHASLSYSILY